MRPTNGMAVASLVLALLWLGGVASILALWCGYRARHQLADHHESGAGLATAGIVIGWIGVVAFAVVVIPLYTDLEELRAGVERLRRMFGDGFLG